MPIYLDRHHIEMTERYCVVLQTLRRGVEVTVA
jgi:hypothetical protein